MEVHRFFNERETEIETAWEQAFQLIRNGEVTPDLVSKIESHLLMRHYEGFVPSAGRAGAGGGTKGFP